MQDPPENSAGAPPHIVIRALRCTDFEAVATISALPGFRAGTLRLPFQDPELTRKFIEARGEGDLGLAAERDGLVVGTAGWQRFRGRRAHAATIGMGVHDDHVGQGIGTALLESLVDAADRWFAIRRLELTVFADNEGAIRLYRRFGFEVEGTLRDFAFRDGRYVDAITMARIRAVG